MSAPTSFLPRYWLRTSLYIFGDSFTWNLPPLKSAQREPLRFGSRFQVSDQVGAVVFLLQTGEDHLCAGNVFLRVCQVDVQRVLAPSDPFLDISGGVAEAGGLPSFPSPHAVQIGPGLVFPALLDRVALGAPLDENLFSFPDVSRGMTAVVL